MAAGLYSALAQGKGTIGATTMSAHKVPPKRIEEPHPSIANDTMLKTPPATESHHTGYRKHEREARPRAVTTLIARRREPYIVAHCETPTTHCRGQTWGLKESQVAHQMNDSHRRGRVPRVDKHKPKNNVDDSPNSQGDCKAYKTRKRLDKQDGRTPDRPNIPSVTMLSLWSSVSVNQFVATFFGAPGARPRKGSLS